MKCQWFALCEYEAVAKQTHPILGQVPICKRCQDKLKYLEERVKR
jgi:hypothetical protein